MTKHLSPFQFRQYAESLRAFDNASALRQIDIAVEQGHIGTGDAEGLRNVVTNRRLWLF